MKLIDLLVTEFNKAGGWPKSLESAVHMKLPCGYWTRELNGTLFFTDKSSNHRIYKGEYEAALAASKQVEWDGNGLPPAGCECEFHKHSSGSEKEEWIKVIIMYASEYTCVMKGSDVGEIIHHPRTLEFRPIRNEADRKREDAIAAMRESLGHAAGLIEVANIYRAIAAGKIPGIRLE